MRVISVPTTGRRRSSSPRKSPLCAERKLPWEDFAVLFRMNAQSRLLEENLRELQNSVSRRRREELLRAARDQGSSRLHGVLLNPSDDASLLAHHQHAGARNRPDQRRAGACIQRRTQTQPLRGPATSRLSWTACTRKTADAIRAFVDEIEAVRVRVQTPGADCCAYSFLAPGRMRLCGRSETLLQDPG